MHGNAFSSPHIIDDRSKKNDRFITVCLWAITKKHFIFWLHHLALKLTQVFFCYCWMIRLAIKSHFDLNAFSFGAQAKEFTVCVCLYIQSIKSVVICRYGKKQQQRQRHWNDSNQSFFKFQFDRFASIFQYIISNIHWCKFFIIIKRKIQNGFCFWKIDARQFFHHHHRCCWPCKHYLMIDFFLLF